MKPYLRLVIAILLPASVFSNVFCTLNDKGLAGYLKFDEGAGNTTVNTVNSLRYSINGAAAWESGIKGMGLRFNGINTTLELTDESSYDFNWNSKVTFAFWYKREDGISNPSEIIYIKMRGPLNGPGNLSKYGYRLAVGPYKDGQKQMVFQHAGDHDIASQWMQVYCDVNLNDSKYLNKWHHYAVTYNGSGNGTGVKFYIDGLEQAVQIIPGYESNTTNTLNDRNPVIGAEMDRNQLIKGVFDEFRIYKRELSGLEIQDIYTADSSSLKQEETTGNGLMGYWKFDEGSGNIAYDYSGNNNNGKIFGANFVTGKINSGLDFNGTATYVRIPCSKSLNIINSLTLEAWAYFRGEVPGTGDQGNHIAITKACNDSVGQYLLGRYQQDYNGNPHKFFFALNNSGWTDYIAEQLLEDGQWYHLAGTYDRQYVKLYINGKLVQAVSKSGPITGGTKDLYIGLNPISGIGKPESFNGIIDEVKIYNRALSETEIRADMNNSVSQPETEQEQVTRLAEIIWEIAHVQLKPFTDGISKSVVETLKKGDIVVILKQSPRKTIWDNDEDYWYKIRTAGGNEGWLFGKSLRIHRGQVNEPAPVEVPQAQFQVKSLNIAVAEFEARGVSQPDAISISDFFRTAMVNANLFNIVERSNMERILAEQKFQLSGCTTQECAVQMGKLLNVTYIITGTLIKMMDAYYINVSVIDIETGRITHSDKIQCINPYELADKSDALARIISQRLIGK